MSKHDLAEQHMPEIIADIRHWYGCQGGMGDPSEDDALRAIVIAFALDGTRMPNGRPRLQGAAHKARPVASEPVRASPG